MMIQKGPGSLFSVLRQRNLCTDLDVKNSFFPGFGFYTIICTVTRKGVEFVDEIVTLIFQVSHDSLKNVIIIFKVCTYVLFTIKFIENVEDF